MASLKGRPTRRKPRLVIKYDINFSSDIYKNNSNVELCIDVIYIYIESHLWYLLIEKLNIDKLFTSYLKTKKHF